MSLLYFPAELTAALQLVKNKRAIWIEVDGALRLTCIRIKGILAADAIAMYQTITNLPVTDNRVKYFISMVENLAALQLDGEWGYIKSPDTPVPFMMLVTSDSGDRNCINLKILYPDTELNLNPVRNAIRYQFGLNTLLAF